MISKINFTEFAPAAADVQIPKVKYFHADDGSVNMTGLFAFFTAGKMLQYLKWVSE